MTNQERWTRYITALNATTMPTSTSSSSKKSVMTWRRPMKVICENPDALAEYREPEPAKKPKKKLVIKPDVPVPAVPAVPEYVMIKIECERVVSCANSVNKNIIRAWCRDKYGKKWFEEDNKKELMEEARRAITKMKKTN